MADVAPNPAALTLTADLVPRVNLALQQNHVPLLRRLEIYNAGDEPTGQVRIDVSACPAFFEPWQGLVDSIAPATAHVVAPVPLVLAPDFLARQVEREAGYVEIRVERAGREPQVQRVPVDVLAPHEWGGLAMLPELLAAFVRPNAAVLAPILSDAAARLQATTGDAALAGYQRRDPLRVAQTAQALYEAVQATGLTYINPPASFEKNGQKIRTHEQVLEQRLGTCLDLTVLFAALLEQAGLNPMVLLVQEHAFPGVWLTDFALQEPALDNPRPIRKRVELGEALVFDSSAVTQGATFAQAQRVAEAALTDDAHFVAAIDIHCARTHQIRPLPFDRAQAPQGMMPGPALQPAPLLPTDGLRFAEPQLAAPPPLGSARVERWKAKLLDLSLRNRLLNFRASAKTCALPLADAAGLEDTLAADGQLLLEPKLDLRTLLPRLQSEGGELPDEAVRAKVHEIQKRGVLHTDLPPAEHTKVMTELWRLSRAAFEDSGAVLLYAAIGMLEWFETPTSQVARRAPLLLVPVLLERGAAGRWTLRRADDETRVNVTLLKKLEADFGLDVAGHDQLPEDAAGVDVPQVLQRFRHLVRDQDRWLVHAEAHLGLFSFQKFLMWLDLQAKHATLIQNPVVAHLLAGKASAYPLAAELLTNRDMDRVLAPEQTLHVVDADPSQCAAIHAAESGSSFVLQGPPGTGKSQTITNLIAQLLAVGKTVLFVSEKRAALEVVRTRLDKVGLGPFCLELHSNQASKSAVMAQLRAAFEVTRQRDSATWQQHATDLARTRAGLNAYATLLDRPSPFGTATRGVLAWLFGRESVPQLALPALALETLTDAQVASLVEATQQLAHASQEAGGLAGHPWRAAQREDWDPLWQRQVEAQLAVLIERADAAVAAQSGIAQRLGLPEGLTLGALVQAANVLLDTKGPPAALLEARGFAERHQAVEALLQRANTLAERRQPLRAAWREPLWGMDLGNARQRLDKWAEAFVLLAWLMLWGVRAALRPVAVAGLPPPRQLRDDLSEVQWQQEESRALAASPGPSWLGALWQGADTDIAAAQAVLEWSTRFQAAVRAVASEAGSLAATQRMRQLASDDAELLAVDTRLHSELQGHLAAVASYEQALAAASDLLQLDHGLLVRGGPMPAAMAAQGRTWLANLPRLRNWCVLAGACRSVQQAGLAPLVQALDAGQLAPNRLRDVLDRSLREAWWNHQMAREPLLRGFRGAAHAEQIARFRNLDRQALLLARQEVVARVAERAPDANAPGDEMALLRRQLTLQRAHRPIRQLFAKIPTTLRRLKPCVLMSPLSVAQYLDPSVEGFDVVVFDEASQIPPWDAVGAIARGKQVIVVGDSKQLPPTSFFDRGSDEEEDSDRDDEDAVDTESILDEMQAAGLHELLLKWHYRSKHESLIAFSNWHYYDNRLHTFPSAAAEVPHLGVKYVRVAGSYDRGGSRTNRAEAQAVVQELFRLLALPDGERPSVGIVTFSQVQQRLVEDLVDARLSAAPELQKFFGDAAAEPVFIKNLENVQGDERDVMLFSICYGPDAAGKMTMNFGPLNRKGGERRLNVAVTRARQRLVVFSVLEWGQIDENKSRALGVAHLKAFLRYAEHGASSFMATTAAAVGEPFDSPFEQEVHRILTAAGWQVDSQVGCSGYRVDLAVRHPQRPGTYLLGIECDGATYHRSHVARERDRLREDVLVSLGWQIHRIWSTDWWYDREAATQKLLAALSEAQVRAATAVVAVPAPVAVAAPAVAVDSSAFAAMLATPAAPTWPEGTSPFVAPAFAGQAGDREAFYLPAARPLLAESLAKLVASYGPLHADAAARLIAAAWGFGRTGKQISDQIEQSVLLLAPSERPKRAGDYWWPRQHDPRTWQGFRYAVGSEARALDEVAPQEIANVAAWVVRRAVSIGHAELLRETARVLGAKALTAKAITVLEAAMPLARERGIADSDGRWRAT